MFNQNDMLRATVTAKVATNNVHAKFSKKKAAFLRPVMIRQFTEKTAMVNFLDSTSCRTVVLVKNNCNTTLSSSSMKTTATALEVMVTRQHQDLCGPLNAALVLPSDSSTSSSQRCTYGWSWQRDWKLWIGPNGWATKSVSVFRNTESPHPLRKRW